MSEQQGASGPVEYDTDRLADDPEYRNRILQDIAESSSSLTTADVTRRILTVVLGFLLFAAGVFLGGKIGEQYAFYTSLLMTCFIVFPALAYLLYFRQRL